MKTRRLTLRSAFTLVEMMIAITLFSLILAAILKRNARPMTSPPFRQT